MATTETLPDVVEVSNLGHRGFYIREPLSFQTALRTNLGTRKKGYELGKESETTTATVWLGLYHLGETIVEHEREGKVLPKDVQEKPEGDRLIGKLLYLDCQSRARGEQPWRGVWFSDVLDYDAKPATPTVVPEGFVYAELIKGVEDWEVDEKKDIYVPQGGIRIPVEVPLTSGGFAVPNGIHVYDPFTGIPKKVEPNPEKALKALVNSGYTEKQARTRMSRVYSKDSGLAVVGSYADQSNGPLCLYLYVGPWSRLGDVGSVAASRLRRVDADSCQRPVEGASPASELVPRSEYASVLRARDQAIARAGKAEGKLAELRAQLDAE